MKKFTLTVFLCLIALPLAAQDDSAPLAQPAVDQAPEETINQQAEKIDSMIETLTPNATIQTLRIKKDETEAVSPRAEKQDADRISNKIKWQRPQKHHYKKKN